MGAEMDSKRWLSKTPPCNYTFKSVMMVLNVQKTIIETLNHFSVQMLVPKLQYYPQRSLKLCLISGVHNTYRTGNFQ